MRCPFARKVADRIIFMDKGKIIEQASPQEFFEQPKQNERKPSKYFVKTKFYYLNHEGSECFKRNSIKY